MPSIHERIVHENVIHESRPSAWESTELSFLIELSFLFRTWLWCYGLLEHGVGHAGC